MTKPIYLASYKGTHSGLTGGINIGIRWLTSSIYSHSEVCIGDPTSGEVVECASSSGVEGGVRSKSMSLSPDKWDFVPVPWVSESDVRKALEEYSGAKYDFVGCSRFLLPFMLRESATKWFCSEFAGYIMGYKEAWRFSPADLHMIVSNHQTRRNDSNLSS
jgi:hypothetical protein